MTSSKGFSYPHARKAVMVDAVVLGILNDQLHTLLIQRKEAPYRGWWALPGGHVKLEETLEEAVHRELVEETGVQDLYFEQVHAFSALKRDPREPTISIAFFALVQPKDVTLHAGTDAKDARWFPLSELPRLAFDHAAILDVSIAKMRKGIQDRPLLAPLMPPKFTLRQLRLVYEQLLGVSLDGSNFRRDILKKGFIEELEETHTEVANRFPKLCRFTQQPQPLSEL